MLSTAFHLDVKWWLSYLEEFNGVVYYNRCDQVNVHTDACNVGAGMFSNGDWWYVNWAVDLPGTYQLQRDFSNFIGSCKLGY